MSLAGALHFAAIVHQFRREEQAAKEQIESTVTLSNKQGFQFFSAIGTIDRGWVLTAQGQREEQEEGITQIRQGLAAYQSIGAELWRPHFLSLLAEAYGKVGQAEQGLSVLDEALTTLAKTEERFYEAELYRLKGTLTLQRERQRATGRRQQATGTEPRSPNRS